MKEILQIGADVAIDASQSVLLLEVGKSYLFFAVMSQANRTLEQAAFYSQEENDEDDLLALVLEKNHALYSSFYQTIISYHFPESLLIPDRFYKYEDAQLFLNNVYGPQADTVVIAEAVKEWDLYNIYHIPQPLSEAVKRHFSNGKYWHTYSVGLKNINRQSNASVQLIIDFKPAQFTLLLVKQNTFHLAQTFCYENAEDAMYYLLKVCEQSSISRFTATVIIGGLITHHSEIVDELQKYFSNIEYRTMPDNIRLHDFFKNYPSHFFSGIYNLAACVS